MWLAVLGPLLVHDGETQLDVPRGRQRVLLAALLLHAGNPVAAGTLAEIVWDGSPPSGAAVTLRSHVLRLRRALGPRVGARLVTRQPGYLLQARQDEVDVFRFRGLCRDGGTALQEGAWARTDGLLGEALALWRGAAIFPVRFMYLSLFLHNSLFYGNFLDQPFRWLSVDLELSSPAPV